MRLLLLTAAALLLSIASLAQSPFALVHRSRAEMSPSDARLLASSQAAIREAARIHGYDLAPGDWTVQQVLCPLLPNSLLLHYRRSSGGRDWLFTAIVPRGGADARVLVVPVYYGNATPFHSAVRTASAVESFNRAVSPDLAQQFTAPGGNFIAYAACFAEVVGGTIAVAVHPQESETTYTAPVPTVLIRDAQARQIRFTARYADGSYQVWDLSLDRTGRVARADSSDRAAQAYPVLHPALPRTTIVQTSTRPRVGTLSPPVPEAKTLPQHP